MNAITQLPQLYEQQDLAFTFVAPALPDAQLLVTGFSADERINGALLHNRIIPHQTRHFLHNAACFKRKNSSVFPHVLLDNSLMQQRLITPSFYC
ncbi:hypothetical protein PsAD2_03724 [Pseudovibrio axinellae]|uniref:Uncharacterized protein n=1 Tax=Pseudovibrio axinellae TaxID=989403 RepID=A0A165VQP8_9HYPH|nr:hypothetical protein [Pseudovibrio axinellae]KZL15219.1 hypothetical protein PsAD2_03724 [Pseudovibrio axinellae]SER94152.1 hypothetical protein SAMN05421798_1724 [Pseudovibrio axinellae]